MAADIATDHVARVSLFQYLLILQTIEQLRIKDFLFHLNLQDISYVK